jgi:uncharacterized protein YkwD
MIKYFLLGVLLFAAGGDAGKFLDEIALYQKDSYFKEKVYAEHDWKSFSGLKEVNQSVNPDNYDLHLLNAAVFFATNKIRAEKKQKELSYSSALRNAAVVHSQQMVDRKFFNHFGKAPKLRSPDDRIKLFGTTNATAEGENIDYNHMQPGKTTYWQIAEQIVDDFYHSSEHKKTMLSKLYTHLGCAAVLEVSNKDGGLRYYKATQDYSAQ